MTDLQRIVDEIRFALQAQVCEQSEALQERASLYAAACHDVNVRLRRCDDLLRRNLRSEAIHLAEADPNLLDLVATLDFPERAEWAEIVALYDMAEPEPLLVDIAQDLNQAYSTVQPLQKLLAKHRLLAMSHAPLAERLDVMRLLDGLDLDGGFWDEDIRTFELARFQEIESEARSAARTRDEPLLASLLNEVRADIWREDVPTHLVALLRRYSGSVIRSGAQQQIGQLTEDLEAAFSELDLSRARQLRTTWLDAAAKSRLPDNDLLRERVEPILGWLLDEDAREEADNGFRASLGALDQALSTDVGLEELQQRYHGCLRFERSIPEPLMVRYQGRTRTLEQAESRARRLKIGFVATLALGVTVLAVLLTRQHQQNSVVTKLVASVEPVLSGGAFDDARKLLEAHPEVAHREEVIGLRARITEDELRDKSRKAAFDNALKDARSANDYVTASLALKSAGQLAEFDPEKRLVKEVTDEWNNRRAAEQLRREQAFQKDLDAALVELAQLQVAADADAGSPETGTLLQAVKGHITTLKGAALQLSPKIASGLEPLQTQHAALDERRESTLNRRQLAQLMTARVLIAPSDVELAQSVDSYGESLLAYAAALEMDPLSEEFRSVNAERPHWTASLAWHRLLQSWPVLWPADMEGVSARVAACEKFLKESDLCPEAAEAREYLAALRAIQHREAASADSSEVGIRIKLRNIFNHHLIKDAWLIKTGDGRTFYVREEEDYSSFKDSDPVTPRHRVGYAQEDIKGARGLKGANLLTKRPLPAPQNKIAKFVADRSSLLTLDGWDPFFFELAQQIHRATELDAYLRYDLLKRVLDAGSAGSRFFKEAVDPQLRHLKQASIDPQAMWMDPTNPDANKSRETAAEILKTLPEFGDVLARSAAARQAFETRLRTSLTMVGWLEQIDGNWICHSNWTPPGDHDLYVVFCDKPESRAEWRRIGEANSEGLTIQTTDRAFLRPGRPVFAMPRGADSASVAANPSAPASRP